MSTHRSLPHTCLLIVLIAAWTIVLAAQSTPTSTPASSSVSAPAAAPSPAAAPVPAPVQVTSHGDQLEVKVPDQAPLSTVMSSLCQQQKLKCTGTETLTTYHGPAMSVEGTLRQVIAKLVEGTDINYEFSRSAEGGASAIAFLGHAPKGTAPVPVAEQPAPTAPPRPLHPRPFPGRVPPDAGPPPPPEQSPTPQSQLIEPNAATPAAVPSDVVAEQSQAARILFTGSGSLTTSGSPFPDAQGNALPTNNTPPTAQPFPDQFGNPIPLKPATGGSPFPNTGPAANPGTTKQ